MAQLAFVNQALQLATHPDAGRRTGLQPERIDLQAGRDDKESR